MSTPIVLLAAGDPPLGEEWLRPVERAALLRFRVARRRLDFRRGRWAAKRALVHLEGGEPPAFEIRPAPGGAPVAFRAGRSLAVALSISHSGGCAAAAVSDDGRPLGCDIERVEPRSPAFVEDYFTPEERAFVETGPRGERSWRATLVWSAKESVMKALGEGLRLPPTTVRVAPALAPRSDAGWCTFAVLGPPAAAHLRGYWRVLGELVLTVACAGSEPLLLGPSAASRSRPRRGCPGR